MEGPTTEVPTYASITYRPTEFLTSSIREPKVPTRLPAPTIELFIARQCQRRVQRDWDRGEEGGVDDPPPADYYINGTNQINMTALELVSGGGTIWTGTGP
jgi:hypothetical protein